MEKASSKTGRAVKGPRGNRLLLAARDVCEREGVERLTMRRIAASAGVTAPAIYRHFASKAAVLTALVDDANLQLGGFLGRAARGKTAWSRMERAIDAFVDFAIEEPTSYDILFFSRNRTDEALEPKRLRSLNFRIWLGIVEECREDGFLDSRYDAMDLALTLWATLQGLLSLNIQGRFGHDPRAVRRAVKNSISHLLAGIGRDGA